MAVLSTDFFTINRGGTPGDGSSGTYYVAPISDLNAVIVSVSTDTGNLITSGADGGSFLNQLTIQDNETTTALSQALATGVITFTDEDSGTQTANVRSTDAGNILTTGTDGGNLLTQADVRSNETPTSLTYDAGTSTLTYTGEVGAPVNLDLSGLTTDIYVNNATIDANGIITFTDNDAGTPDFTLDLSAFYNSLVDDQVNGNFVLSNGVGSTTVQKTAFMSLPIAP